MDEKILDEYVAVLKRLNEGWDYFSPQDVAELVQKNLDILEKSNDKSGFVDARADMEEALDTVGDKRLIQLFNKVEKYLDSATVVYKGLLSSLNKVKTK
jgi:hypothetical protein